MKQRVIDSYKRLRATSILANFVNLSSIQISNILLLLITTRLVTGTLGVEGFGVVMFAYRFSLLAGTVINYGTGQSGVKDVVLNLADKPRLSAVFYNTLSIRCIILLLYLVFLGGYYYLHTNTYQYVLLALPVVLAEVLNPICFFIGIEKIRVFNVANLLSNIAAVAAIFLFIKTPGHGVWVNFILGMANVITYAILLAYFAKNQGLSFAIPQKSQLLTIGKANFYLTVNNISANLQQSVIVFALTATGSTVLGAYSLADRFIGQCRNLLNIISNAIYPNAVNLYKQSATAWDAYRKRTKYTFAGLFLLGAIITFFLADVIVFILSNEHDADTILMLRVMAFSLVISALNVFSVLDMLIKGKNVYLFKVALALVGVAAVVAFGTAHWGNKLLIGAFTFLVELCAWAMYEYVITKPVVNHA